MTFIEVFALLLVLFVSFAVLESFLLKKSYAKRKAKILEKMTRQFERWKEQGTISQDWIYGYIICLEDIGFLTREETCDLLHEFEVYHF